MIHGILLCLFASQFSPMAKMDPGFSWYTLESEHFSVHFSGKGQYQDEEQLAREIVWYCEDAYNRLTPFMRWQPKQKTRVVVGDVYDYVSGWATPFPNNTIFICPTFDKEMRVNYYDWLEQLIIHEYTHILNMDMVHGLPRFFRIFFGKIIVPNTVMPLCFNEGFSVYNESRFSAFGRNQSSFYQMMMRSRVLDKNIFPIDKCVTYELAQYPGGETPYFYGSMFYSYLADKYTEKKLADYSNWLSGGIPLFYNVQAKRVFGKSFYTLWRDFREKMKEKYSKQIQAIQTKQITQTTQLTREGFNTESPIYSLDDNQIFYISKTNHDYPSVKVVDLTTNKTKRLLKKIISSPIRMSQDGSKLIFSIRSYEKNFYQYDDLYSYDIKSRKIERLTKGLRATDPDFSPIQNQVIFVKNELGQTNLCIIDLESNEITQLTHSEGYTQYAQPRYAPDGKKVAVAVWKIGGYQDIYIYDLTTDWLIPVTQDQSLDIEPCWSNDGNYLLFSSDRSGVFNIFAYSLKNRKLYQVTNVLTGAFAPTISSDNKKLAMLLYSSKGYDIHTTDITLDSLIPAESVSVSDSGIISYSEWQFNSDSIHATLYHYSPFPSILPKFWLPLAMYDNGNEWSFGAVTYGADALFQHQYLIQSLYNTKTKKPTVYFDYTLDKLYPTIYLNTVYDQGKIDGTISTVFPFIKNEHQQYLSLYYQYEKDEDVGSGLGVSYQFSNAKYYSYSISPEQGRYFGLRAKRYDKIFFSQYNLTNTSGVFREYINLPFRHHVLMLSTQIGMLWGDRYYSIGRGDASFRIRGYAGSEIIAHHIISATAEYRFPFFWIERGLGTFPLFFQNVSGDIFFDIGKGFNSLSTLRNSLSTIKGAGAELQLNSLVFYEIPLKLTLGFGFDPKDYHKNQIYFEINQSLPFLNKGLFSSQTIPFH